MISEAERWEGGSADDPIRNQFVIPTLAGIIQDHRPRAILDVGAGTGYVARKIDALLDAKPFWTLSDLKADRLQLAQANQPADMKLECVAGNVFDWPWE